MWRTVRIALTIAVLSVTTLAGHAHAVLAPIQAADGAHPHAHHGGDAEDGGAAASMAAQCCFVAAAPTPFAERGAPSPILRGPPPRDDARGLALAPRAPPPRR